MHTGTHTYGEDRYRLPTPSSQVDSAFEGALLLTSFATTHPLG